MCDQCTRMFSVNEAGWKQWTETTSQNNAYNHGARTMHMCGDCAPTGRPEAMRPTVGGRIADTVVELEKAEVVEKRCWYCGEPATLQDGDGDWECNDRAKTHYCSERKRNGN